MIRDSGKILSETRISRGRWESTVDMKAGRGEWTQEILKPVHQNILSTYVTRNRLFILAAQN